MSRGKQFLPLALALAILTICAWSQTSRPDDAKPAQAKTDLQKSNAPRPIGDEIEAQIKAVALKYCYSTLFGDADEYLSSVKLPIYVMRDGVAATRDEKTTRALLSRISESMTARKLSDDDKKQMVGNLIAQIDACSIQFVGSNTATITFPIKVAAKPEDGDNLIELVMTRKDGKWLAMGEITDSTPVPAEWLK